MSSFDVLQGRNPWQRQRDQATRPPVPALESDSLARGMLPLAMPSAAAAHSPVQASPFLGMYDDCLTKQKDGDHKADATGKTLAGGSQQSADEEKEKDSPDKTKKRKVKQLQQLIDRLHRLDKQAAKLQKQGKSDEAEAKRQESAALKEQAIDQAIDAYDIDVSNAKFVDYDAGEDGEGGANRKGEIRLGDAAFQSGSWLGSTIGHESEIHINEQLQKGNWYTGKQGTALQEVQAYQYEIDNAERFGTSRKNLKELKRRRKSHLTQLSDEYPDRAGTGDYTMKAGEESL